MADLASKWCSIYRNLGYISVSTSTGYRRSAYDPNGVHLVLKESSSDEELGSAIMDALQVSKALKESQVGEFFNLENVEKNYALFVDRLIQGMVVYRYPRHSKV